MDAQDRILGEEYEDPSNALTIERGVIADFECALADYIVAGGLVGNEFTLIVGGVARNLYYDRRSFATSGLGATYGESTCSNKMQGVVGVYRPLSTARWHADRFLELLDGWTDAEVPERTSLIAVAAAYSGYSHLLLGEGMCEAAFDLGAVVPSSEIFARAEQRFSRAIDAARAAGNDEILHMALVGRARTRLNLGEAADAAADAAQVPEGFVKYTGYSSTTARRENEVYIQGQAEVVVGANFRGATFGGVLDPRVPVVNTGEVAGEIPVWRQAKYPSRDAPIPIARWEEAQLILAEAELAAGDAAAAAAAIIDDLHTRAGLPAFEGGTQEEVAQHLIQERQRELFLEGHHQGDIRRYGLPLDPPPGAPYHLGGVYGDQTCYPLPDIERLNNPNARD